MTYIPFSVAATLAQKEFTFLLNLCVQGILHVGGNNKAEKNY